jgi:threonine/homoserine/homoserine lactone efflux protein
MPQWCLRGRAPGGRLRGDRLLAFAGLALVVIVIPGPSVLFIVGRALAHGRRTALASVAGNELGELTLVVLVPVGGGTLAGWSAAVFRAVKLASAGYLVFLGIRALLQRRGHEPAGQPAGPRHGLRAVADGYLVGVANPKTVIFLAAILPQFADRAAGHVPLQMLALGLVYIVIAAVSDSVWSVIAGTARAWFGRSPRRLRIVGGAGGLAMIGLGITLAVTGRKD